MANSRKARQNENGPKRCRLGRSFGHNCEDLRILVQERHAVKQKLEKRSPANRATVQAGILDLPRLPAAFHRNVMLLKRS